MTQRYSLPRPAPTGGKLPAGLPEAAGYTHAFTLLALLCLAAALAALVPVRHVRRTSGGLLAAASPGVGEPGPARADREASRR